MLEAKGLSWDEDQQLNLDKTFSDISTHAKHGGRRCCIKRTIFQLALALGVEESMTLHLSAWASNIPRR